MIGFYDYLRKRSILIIYKCNDYLVSYDEKNQEYVAAKNFDFYKLDQSTFKEIFDVNALTFIKNINDNIFFTFFMVGIIIFTIGLYFTNTDYALVNVHFFQATIVLMINVIIHESGHILFLKIFYPHSKIKIGFKFVFIYPAFYVDTSYSYLLPKYKRIAVYLAGNFTNCLFVLVAIFFIPSILPYSYLVMSNLLVNFLPIVKSDGYYATITCFNRTNKKMSKKREQIDDFVRGAIMFAILSILSYF